MDEIDTQVPPVPGRLQSRDGGDQPLCDGPGWRDDEVREACTQISQKGVAGYDVAPLRVPSVSRTTSPFRQLPLGSASHRITGTIYGEQSERSVLSTSQSRVQPGTIACVAAGVVVTR